MEKCIGRAKTWESALDALENLEMCTWRAKNLESVLGALKEWKSALRLYTTIYTPTHRYTYTQV